MKYILLPFLLLSFTVKTLEKQITSPYEPSFSSKHPKFAQRAPSIGLGITVSAITYAGLKFTTDQDSSSSLKYSVLAGLIAGGLATYYSKPIQISFLDKVLFHPDQALSFSYQIEEQLDKKCKEEKLNDDIEDSNDHAQRLVKFRSLVSQFESKAPLLLLGECITEGFGPCILSRCYNKKYRAEFERKIVDALTQHAKTDKPVVYASFGCGGKFQDIVTLTKWLAKTPQAQIDIHLIDMQHTPFVASCDFLGNKRQITEQPINYSGVMPQLLEKGKKEWGADKHPEETCKRELAVTITKLDLKHKEFLNWLRGTFPKSTIRLFSHDSTQSYLNFIENNSFEYPDVINAADIQDEMSCLRHAGNNYIILCSKTLAKKPTSTNILLAKNNHKATLVSVSNEKTPGSIEESYTDFDKQERKVYCSEKNL